MKSARTTERVWKVLAQLWQAARRHVAAGHCPQPVGLSGSRRPVPFWL